MIFVVTGVSSGLGYEISKRLLVSNSVIGISRTIGKASSLIGSHGIKWKMCDFSSADEVEIKELLESIRREVGNEDVTLVLNAAQFYMGNSRLTLGELKQLMCVNYLIPCMLVEGFKTFNLKRVMFINSISGLVGQSTQHEYVSSKHALMGYAKSLAREAKNSNYDVMIINPGGIKTELWEGNEEVNTEDFISPSILADLCCSLISVKQRVFIDQFVILPPSDI